MNLSLRQLRAFVAVAQRGSFTEAARELHLTQSALSVLVRELESELGVRLLDRHTRRVRLSEAGGELLPRAQRILQELAQAVASVGSLRDKKRGYLRLAAPQLMACTLIPRLIAAYSARYPDIEVVLQDTLPEQTLAAVLSGAVELAVGPEVPGVPELQRQPLLQDRHWLIVPRGHRLAGRKSVQWEALVHEPFIAPTRDFMTRLAPELHATVPGLVLQPAHEVSYMTTALGMVAQGLGVTACPSYAAPLVKAWGLQMRPLTEPVFFRNVCLFNAIDRSLSPAAQSFVELVQTIVQDMEPPPA